MSGHKHIDSQLAKAPGPHWAPNPCPDDAADWDFSTGGAMRAFWPLEWRLVVEWIQGLRLAGWEVEPHGTHAEIWSAFPPYSVETGSGGEIRISPREVDDGWGMDGDTE